MSEDDKSFESVGLPADIAESNPLETEAGRLNDRMRLLLDVSPTVIYAHENPNSLWQCTYISANIARLTGYTAETILAEPEFWQRHLHPEDRSRVFAGLKHLLASGESEIEYRFRTASGDYIWVRDLTKVVRDEAGDIRAIVGSWADITAAKRLENERRRFWMAVEACAEMILLTDAEGFIEYANPSFFQITGRSPAEVIGKKNILQGDTIPSVVAEDMRNTLMRGDSWRGRLLDRRKGPPVLAVAGQAGPPDTLAFWAEVSITPIRNDQGSTLGYVSVQRDISAQVAEEERLAMEREDIAARLRIAELLSQPEPLEIRCSNVLDSLFGLRGLGVQNKGGIFLKRPDSEGLTLFLTRGDFSEEFLRREQHVPLGACLCGRAAASGELLVSDDCFCDPRHEHRFENMTSHGHYIVPLQGNGTVLGILFLYTDPYPPRDPSRLDKLRQIGELLGFAILREQAAEELRKARDAAYEASRLKSEFLANMSHEIRTPMNGVLGMLELLKSTPLSTEQREFADTAHHSAEALLHVINDILDFSKIEAGKLQLEVLDFDLCQLVEEVSTLLAGRAHAKGLELHCFVAPELPAKLRGDPTRLRQVLTNLIGNAIKFTERGEVCVEAQCLSEDAHQVRIRISVKDTGIGISQEAQARLFRPFVQADGATTRRFGGTGLGLAISKELVERMGGEIGVDSAPGEGSTFWFTAVLDKQSAESAPEDRGFLVGRRVLIVDDNATSRRILENFLRQWGVVPELAEHAHIALEKLRTASDQGRPYDLAILDLQMPDMSGLELSRAMMADAALRQIPRLMLSSSGPVEESEREAVGIAKVLNKPVRQSYLYDAVASLLRNGKLASEVAEPTVGDLPDYSRYRILLVEDNAINQKVAARMLRRFGLEPTLAHDGHEALTLLQHDRYDLVLMDCQMPNLDGYEATRAWRVQEQARRLPRIPIVALTANAMQTDREACLAAGMDDHLAKPFTMGSLGRMLAKWLEKAPSADDEDASASSEATALLWDRDQSLRQIGGDRALLEELLHMFVDEEAPEELARLAAAVEQRQLDAIAKSAHNLKGLAGHFFASEVMTLAAQLENEARQGNVEQAVGLAAQLDAAVRRLCGQMSVKKPNSRPA